ncbi:bifunctional adenosylcobinamide kinase/adenosylcobinamide-phosphate guanylyltransferase, partial [Allorhizocola rhizosphaerae]|uniref:bifunctional adenosylcobinamide kinase/adenosylcobinamide-phosphate guanylyltransferase n=1 Tax=Allorhizocola rhizosphaerae TaxID=1872709 RepID=UPI0013C2F6AF
MVGGKVLVLGGIRSGKSAYAESLLDEAERVRYVATAAADEGDAAFAERIAAHRFRRPASWETVETGGEPGGLIETISAADVPLLVDDLGGWAAGLLGRTDAGELVAQLAEAIERSNVGVVLVSPEVGLSVVPPTEAGVEFADLVGRLNQAVARVCDTVTLIVAGQPTVLKKGRPAPAPKKVVQQEALTEQTQQLPIVQTGLTVIAPGMDL